MPDTPANPIPSEHPHDGALTSCTLTDWIFTRYHTPGKSEYAVVYGTVAQDGAGRFATGSRIRTSPVTRWAAPLAHTHNSVYCLPEGAGCFCDLPAVLQPAIDSLGIAPAEAAVILQNTFMQPAHALPETACFGVPVMRPAGQGDCPVVMERHIAELPFYPFWRDSSIGSAQSLIDGQAAVFLHDWNAVCRWFVRTGNTAAKPATQAIKRKTANTAISACRLCIRQNRIMPLPYRKPTSPNYRFTPIGTPPALPMYTRWQTAHTP